MNNLKPQHLIILSFLFVIFIGSLLLKLPFATTNKNISYINALFTATSATIVTGLNVLDTGNDFTFFGQLIILILIQIGGLGFMTILIFLSLLLNQKFTIKQKLIIQESITQYQQKNLKQLLKEIIFIVLFFEIIGALILYFRFRNFYHLKNALWQAIFHSISAFCNAGFSLFASSLINFSSDFYVIITIALLIVFGGLGFIVLYEIKDIIFLKKKIRKNISLFSFHSKIILVTTFALIFSSAILIYFFENNNSFLNFPENKKILISLFHSITPRTAGFNAIDMQHLSLPTLFITMILMFIGGSPCSTAGGIKTSSFFILINYFIILLKGQNKIMIFKRTISDELIKRTLAVFFISLLVIIIAILFLFIIDAQYEHIKYNQNNFLNLLFEAISAFGTVGLSLGITSKLVVFEKIIIICLMLIGRIGPLMIALSIFTAKENLKYEYAEEKILIG